MLKRILLLLILLICIVVSIALIPQTQVYILEKVTTHILHVKSTFKIVEFNLDTYKVQALLNDSDTLSLSADYSHLQNFQARLDFSGDVSLFSKVAETTLPKIKTNLQARFQKSNTIDITAELLEGTLEGSFDIDTLSYKALAKHLSLQSYLTQQDMDIYADGLIYLDSHGSFADILDIKAKLHTQNMHLLSPTLKYISELNSSREPLALSSSFSLEDSKLNSSVDVNSSLGILKLSDIAYDLDEGDFALILDLTNKIKAYEVLKTFHIKTSGKYKDANLTAQAYMLANDYKLYAKKLDYIQNRLNIDYKLTSQDKEYADIGAKNPLFGGLIYADDILDANISSILLEDTVDIHLQDNALHVSADKLSLAGILRHIKQEPLATASLALTADVNLSDIKYKADINTQNISLSKELQTTLNNTENIALNVSAYNDAENIIIKPSIESTIFSLKKSKIVFETMKNLLHVRANFKDINISYYTSPTLTLLSDINLSDTLHVSTQIDSENEAITLELFKKDTQIDMQSSFDFKNLNRMSIAKDFNSISGEMNATQIGNRVVFSSYLKDINSTLYKASYADIEGEVLQEKLLHVRSSLNTPYEKLSINLAHDENLSDLNFTYELAQLNRFAALNPDYILDGSGKLHLLDNSIALDINSTQFGLIDIDKEEENISLHVSSFALRELFDLLNQEAKADGNISLDAKINPQKADIFIDSLKIYSLDKNASFRPTPLHVRANLDGNISHYQGEINLEMREENLTCKNFDFKNSPLKLTTDIVLRSNNLENGVVILPDILVGETTFKADMLYRMDSQNPPLDLHVNNNALYLSEKFHKSIDKNATGTLALTMQSDIRLHDNKLDILMTSQSQYHDIPLFHTQVDLNRSTLNSIMKVTSNHIRNSADLRLNMRYINPFSIDALLKTEYESINLNKLSVDIDDLSLEGNYNITLLQTPKKGLFQHGNAELKGEMSNKPEATATLYSDSFGGSLRLKATQKRLDIEADALSLEKLMTFLDTSSALKSGDLDLHVKLLSDDFVELNTSQISGDISLDATHLLLEGIDADKSIETLKNYQDISILDGNIPGMSIVTSIVEAPIDLVSKKEIPKSKILQVHADSYIEDGRFYCYDCAVKTQKNRIAVKGAIDLNSTDFHYFEVGLLQKNGCAFFTQDIKGSAKNPKVELSKTSLSLLTGTVKSVGNVLKDGVNFGTSLISKTGAFVGKGIDTTTGYIPVVNKATGAVSGTLTTITDAPDSANHKLTIECQPFYRGVVSHP